MKRVFMSLLIAGALVSAACSRDDAADTQRQAEQTVSTAAAQTDDTWVTTKVEARFFASPEVKGRTIDVSTSNGVVTLTGAVDNDATRQQAVALARGIDGVRDVQDRLTVSTPGAAATTGTVNPAPSTERPAEGSAVDPAASIGSAWTTTKIQAQFFADGDVKARNIDVTTRDGVVTLSGRVDTEAQRQKAVQLARQTDGVRDVQDQLRVAPDAGAPAPAADAGTTAALTNDQLTARVQSKFYQSEELRRSTLDVRSAGGVVTVSGTVASETRKRQALTTARNVEGVTEVRDEVRVDPTVGPLPARTGADKPGESHTDVTDGWITTKVQAQYYLDPDIKGRQLDVTTKNGVVTLTGSVDHEAMRQQALAIAKETDDVVRVVDKLTIRPVGGRP